MYKVRCVLFDIGGVVIREPWGAIIDAESRYLGMHPAELEGLVAPYFDSAGVGQCSLATMYKQFIDDHSLSRDSDVALRIHLDTYRREALIDSEMVRLILDVRRTHRVGCLSNTEQEAALLNTERGLFRNFDHVFLSHELGMKKPEKIVYEAVAGRLDIPPGSICLVDDVRQNVQAAAAAGMCGFIYVPGNVDAFAKQLRDLLVGPRDGRADSREGSIRQLKLFDDQ